MVLESIRHHNLTFVRTVSVLVALTVAVVGTVGFMHNIQVEPALAKSNLVRDLLLIAASSTALLISSGARIVSATYILIAGLYLYLVWHFLERGISALPGGILPLLMLIIVAFVLGRLQLWIAAAAIGVASIAAVLVPGGFSSSGDYSPAEIAVSLTKHFFICTLLAVIVDRTLIVLRKVIWKSEQRRLELDQALTRLAKEVALRKSMQERLNHASGLEIASFVSAAVSHDFGNLLNVVLGYAHQLEQYAEEFDQTALFQPLNGLTRAAERAVGLNKRILTMTRTTPTEAEAVDVPLVLEELRFFLQASLGQGIELIISIDQEVHVARFDEASLALILLNLALNAKDALNGSGRVEIDVSNAGSMVKLHFSDSGQPIPPLVRKRLFTPFFTTKEPGKGVGLGLFTARQLAMSLGGQLSLGPGDHASFDLQLPRLEAFTLERSPREHIQPPGS